VGHTVCPSDPTLEDPRSSFAACEDCESLENGAGIFDRVLSRLSQWLPGRVFVMSQEGDIGLAPWVTQVGDLVGVAVECPMPTDLRPLSKEGLQVVAAPFSTV
jgi:hypothetical protein